VRHALLDLKFCAAYRPPILAINSLADHERSQQPRWSSLCSIGSLLALTKESPLLRSQLTAIDTRTSSSSAHGRQHDTQQLSAHIQHMQQAAGKGCGSLQA